MQSKDCCCNHIKNTLSLSGWWAAEQFILIALQTHCNASLFSFFVALRKTCNKTFIINVMYSVSLPIVHKISFVCGVGLLLYGNLVESTWDNWTKGRVLCQLINV